MPDFFCFSGNMRFAGLFLAPRKMCVAIGAEIRFYIQSSDRIRVRLGDDHATNCACIVELSGAKSDGYLEWRDVGSWYVWFITNNTCIRILYAYMHVYIYFDMHTYVWHRLFFEHYHALSKWRDAWIPRPDFWTDILLIGTRVTDLAGKRWDGRLVRQPIPRPAQQHIPVQKKHWAFGPFRCILRLRVVVLIGTRMGWDGMGLGLVRDINSTVIICSSSNYVMYV